MPMGRLSMGMGLGTPRTGGGFSTFWDPASRTPSVTLSNSNQTATFTADGAGVRSIQHRVGSRAVVTARLTAFTVGQDASIGFAPPAWVPVEGNGAYPGFDGYTIAVNPVTSIRTDVCVGNVRTQLAIGWDVGQKAQIAIDQVTERLWVRIDKSAGQDGSAWTNWNNSGTANPDTGVGGIDVSAADCSDLYVFCGGYPYGGSTAFTLVN